MKTLVERAERYLKLNEDYGEEEGLTKEHIPNTPQDIKIKDVGEYIAKHEDLIDWGTTEDGEHYISQPIRVSATDITGKTWISENTFNPLDGYWEHVQSQGESDYATKFSVFVDKIKREGFINTDEWVTEEEFEENLLKYQRQAMIDFNRQSMEDRMAGRDYN